MLKLNTERLNVMIRQVHTLTRIRMVLFDIQGNELLSWPEGRCELCTYIRKDPAREQQCRECDRRAFRQCRATHEPMVYCCHAGMTEAVIPLRDEEAHLGYLMLGQILCGKDETQERSRLQLVLRGKGIEGEEADKLMAMVPFKTAEELSACTTLLKMMTVYLLSNRLVSLSPATFRERLERYLEDHLSDAVSVEDLCGYFGVSRSLLYQQAMRQLGCGLGEYILHYRIRIACQLLEETALPIGEISQRVGFSDHNSFSRAFRKVMGFTAREYRNRRRNP
ncbi:MAG: helix-turn-helix domain-containing protein [Clostridiales bacterium]|nr:helix-turn-helix domain-containing protein [Clostridiales bacterium]